MDEQYVVCWRRQLTGEKGYVGEFSDDSWSPCEKLEDAERMSRDVARDIVQRLKGHVATHAYAVEESQQEFVELEERASGPAEELMDELLYAFGRFDTETLIAIANYRELISPGSPIAQLINSYVDVWR